MLGERTAPQTFADQWLPMPCWLIVGIEFGLSLTVTTGTFAAIFKILSDVVLRWRDVQTDALVTALLFTVGQSLIARCLAQTAHGADRAGCRSRLYKFI